MSSQKRNDIRVGLLGLTTAALGIFSACGLGQPVTVSGGAISSMRRQADKHGATQDDKDAAVASGDTAPAQTAPLGEHSSTETTTEIHQSATGNGSPEVSTTAVVAQNPAPATVLAPGILTVSDCIFPSNIRSNQTVSVSFTVSNSGAPVIGFFGTVRMRASVNMFGQTSNIDRSFPVESKETVPSGQTSKTMTFTVPSIPTSTTANVCARAFSDAARSVSISGEICRDVRVN
jgi:hypothetical protein